MLHKSKSRKINLLKYTLVLPFLALFLMGFNTEEVYVEKVSDNSKTINAKNNSSYLKTKIITKDFTDSELEVLKDQLELNHISTVFSNIKRNNKGEILKLTIKLKNFKGNAGATWENNNKPIPNIELGENKNGEAVARTVFISVDKKAPIFKNLNQKNNTKYKTAKKKSNTQQIKPFSVTISKDFTDNDFKNVIKKGKAKGVTLKFSKIKRNSKNEIIGIFAEFKTENGSGNYNLNGDEPIKPFAYTQNNDGFGFGSVSKVKVVGYGNVKFKEGKKIVSTDSIYFDKKNNNKITLHLDSIKSNSNPWKISIGRNTTDSINTTPWKTVIGRPASKAIAYSSSLKTKDGGKPLILLDDIEISEEKIHTINSNNIESITVLKDETAIALHGKKAKDGVVIIKSKNDNVSKIKIGKPLNSTNIKTIAKSDGNGKIHISTDGDKEPLYILDGEEIKKDKLEKIDTDNIESINVLKGDKALEKYGAKAKDGVIEITTKKKN